jgi:type IV secretory pathway VirB2 component (pilin)
MMATGLLSDPPTQSALLGVAYWVKALLLGPVAVAIAVIAVACLGILILQGRIPVRRGVVIVVGCFILFGAPTIAAGLEDVIAGTDIERIPDPAPIVRSPSPAPTSPPTSPGYDPYSGASVPVR